MQKKFFPAVLIFMFTALLSQAQTAAVSNQPPVVPTYRPMPENKLVYGIFEGRPPCIEIARQFKVQVGEQCIKIKWRLYLFHDKNGNPSSYHLEGSFYHEKPRVGKWILSRGTKNDPGAVVIVLDPDKSNEAFHLLKGDDNVLFILNEEKELRVGNENFSYTLNRVKLVEHNPSELNNK